MKKIVKVILSCAVLLGIYFQGWAGDEIKIVSLSPNLTELIFHLGKGDCIVGRSSACDYPEEVKKIPVAGKFGAPSMEVVARLRPDYVVSSGIKDEGVRKNIEGLGIKVLLLPNETIDEYYLAVSELGKILDCQNEAEKEILRVRNIIAEEKKLTEGVPVGKRPRVYLEVWDNPLMTVGKKSFVNDLISISGGVNVAGQEEIGYLKCSREWIILSKPEVIVAPAMGKFAGAEIKKRQGWGETPAVKNDRIYVGMDESVIYRLGPRMTEALKLFRKCFYPEDKSSVNSNGKGDLAGQGGK